MKSNTYYFNPLYNNSTFFNDRTNIYIWHWFIRGRTSVFFSQVISYDVKGNATIVSNISCWCWLVWISYINHSGVLFFLHTRYIIPRSIWSTVISPDLHVVVGPWNKCVRSLCLLVVNHQSIIYRTTSTTRASTCFSFLRCLCIIAGCRYRCIVPGCTSLEPMYAVAGQQLPTFCSSHEAGAGVMQVMGAPPPSTNTWETWRVSSYELES